MVDLIELRRVMPQCSATKAADYLSHLQAAMREFEVTTYHREAAFLAQLAHESGEFRWMEEIASGAAYEGRVDLGNTHKGDGRRYKGRGPIQLTGRANYRQYGELLGLDLEGNPTQAREPQVGFRVAGLYWKLHGLNALADQGSLGAFKTITIGINGGTNGWADRRRYWYRALAVLSKDDSPEGVRIVVGGVEVEAHAALSSGHVWADLRPLAYAAEYGILVAGDGVAVLRLPTGDNATVPLTIRGAVGRVLVSEFPGSVAWDGASKTVTVTPIKRDDQP